MIFVAFIVGMLGAATWDLVAGLLKRRSADPLRRYRRLLRGIPAEHRHQLEAALKQRLEQRRQV